MDKLTCNDFLGGRVRIWQPRHGYRAGVDPVWLAASVPAQAGQSVLELGCGVGVASLCLGARVPGLRVAGVELQPDYADLARRNAVQNAADFQVETGDVRALSLALRQRQFDHVIANPPYFRRAAGTVATDPGRDTALGGDTPLADWVQVAAKRCAPRGYVTFIQRIERLPELMSAMSEVLGSLEMLPFVPRPGRAPQLFLLRGRRGGRAEFRMHPGVLVHAGQDHQNEGEDYTPLIQSVLRSGAALPF
ncbi:tRNA1(Val) (adenine(37)-N6)-methyltransferase [Thalassobius sp. S69A]|uniref:tRNA1(Val) (adenine(37)-N6)-methyltransferase n=1 Tax=unclassified Thalassovita TaxID=2619711 RepID=UPI000C0D751A|nr:methyltransferase [Paracoccaceae bacterium]MBT25102.1 methyltransferase [Paracoccaceae bacterium]